MALLGCRAPAPAGPAPWDWPVDAALAPDANCDDNPSWSHDCRRYCGRPLPPGDIVWECLHDADGGPTICHCTN